MISDEKLQKKIGFVPHKGQEKLIKNKSKLKVICAGRRFGKTKYAGYEATKKALEDNQRIWIIAPDFSLTQIVFEEILANLGKIFGSEGFKLVRKPHPTITLDNGTIIECRSVENPKGMLGRSTDLIVLDEAAVVDREIWQQYLKPTTMDRDGKVIMISTPRGQNWFYDLWVDNPRGRFHFPSYINQHVFKSKDDWEKLKRETPQRVFEQEWEAKFLSDAGSVFRGIDNVVEDYRGEEPVDGRGYILGIDLAKHEDYTVIMAMDRTNLKVVYIDRFKDIDYNLQKERIVLAAKRYNYAKCVIDGTGTGDPVVQDLKRKLFVEDYRIYTNKAKEQLIDKLSIYIEQGMITIPNDEILLDELRRYTYTKKESGMTTYSAPKNRHDDCVIALALCVWGVMAPQTQKETVRRNIIHNEYI